jgi:hypothetical protein
MHCDVWTHLFIINKHAWSLRQVFVFHYKASFYGEELSTPRPTPKLEDYPLSFVRDCLCNIFVATLHIGDRSSIRKPRTHHVVVTGTYLSQPI